MLLYLIRHGDPDYTQDCLTPRGKRQAEAVAHRLANARIDRVYSSTMGRALETAQPTCELLGKECIRVDWAREYSGKVTFPDGEKRTLAQMPGFRILGGGAIDLPYEQAFDVPLLAESGIQSKQEHMIEGARAFLEELGYREENGLFRVLRPSEERIALFCHGNMSHGLLSWMLHIPFQIMWTAFGFTHTGVTVIRFKNEEVGFEPGFTFPHCLTLDDMSHLYAEHLPLQFARADYL